jgi:ATP synthase protein I
MVADGEKHGTHENGDGEAPRTPEGDARLAELGKKLDELKHQSSEAVAGASKTDGMAGAGLAMRMGSEFVAGVIVGFVIGYTIDRVFGTTPWGMVVFLLLGFAAGTLNVLRAAGKVADRYPLPGDKDRRGGD